MSTADPQWEALYQQVKAAPDSTARDAALEQMHARYEALARGGKTSGGLPYPAPTDPFAEGADAIRALAEAVDPPWAGVTFAASFANVRAQIPCQFRVVAEWCELRGTAVCAPGLAPAGAWAAFLTKLPPALIPEGFIVLNAGLGTSGNALPGVAMLNPINNGDVRIAVSVATGQNATVTLDGLRYRVARVAA